MQDVKVTQSEAMIKQEAQIAELQRGFKDDLDRAECAALVFLRQLGTCPDESIHVTGKGQWEAWAADSIVWTVRRLRAYQTEGHREFGNRLVLCEAMRGWGQVREYRGRNGGFLPVGISDFAGMIQNRLEDALFPR